MTQEETIAALEGIDWEYTEDNNSMLVAYQQPIFGTTAYGYRGKTGCIELAFTQEASVDGKKVEPALCAVSFVVHTASVSWEDLTAEITKTYGEASSSSSTTMGWQLPWNESTYSPRTKVVAALLHSGVSEDIANYCAEYGLQGVFPYDEAACKETWQAWEDAASKLNSTYGPVIKLNLHESDGQITVACEAQLAAYDSLEKLF